MATSLASSTTTRVLRLRLKDKHAAVLSQMARDVNLVWNYSQELALKVLERERRFMSAFDIAAYTRGATREGLNLHSQTVQAVSEEYVLRRKQYKKVKLRWRAPRAGLDTLQSQCAAVPSRPAIVLRAGPALESVG